MKQSKKQKKKKSKKRRTTVYVENENFRKSIIDRMKQQHLQKKQNPLRKAQSTASASASTTTVVPFWLQKDWNEPFQGYAFTKLHAPWEANSKEDCINGIWVTQNQQQKDMQSQTNVTLYPKTAKLPPDDSICGIWGTRKHAELDSNGHWYPDNILFYPPGILTPEEDDDSVVLRGQWTYYKDGTIESSSSSSSWPPLTEKAKEAKRRDLLPIWERQKHFDPIPAIVVKDTDADTTFPAIMRGIWKSIKSIADWDSQVQVLLHSKKTKVDRTLPCGVWCTDSKAKADSETGQWDAQDVWFSPPGEMPFKGSVVRGKWTLAEGRATTTITWPPLSKENNKKKTEIKLPQWQTNRRWESQSARVYAAAAAAAADPGPMQDEIDTNGIWMSHNPLPCDDMEAVMDVTIHPKCTAVEDDDDNSTCSRRLNGVWCINPSAKKNTHGTWDCKDVWFFAPGEKPKGDTIVKGKWTLDRYTEWPPLTQKAMQAKEENLMAAKLPKWERQENWRPRPATVNLLVAARPNRHDEHNQKTTRGIWKLPDTVEWQAKVDVVIHPLSAKIDESSSSRPHGIWCTDPSKQSDDHGKWDPNDLWFYPPGVEPDVGAIARGKWILSPGRIEGRWPPPLETTVIPKHGQEFEENQVEIKSQPIIDTVIAKPPPLPEDDIELEMDNRLEPDNDDSSPVPPPPPEDKLDVAWPPSTPKTAKRESVVGKLRIPSVFDSPQPVANVKRMKSMPAPVRSLPVHFELSRSASANAGLSTSPFPISAAQRRKRELEKRFSKKPIIRNSSIDKLRPLQMMPDAELPTPATAPTTTDIDIDIDSTLQAQDEEAPEDESIDLSDHISSPVHEVEVTQEMLDRSISGSCVSVLSWKSPVPQVKPPVTHARQGLVKTKSNATVTTVATNGSHSSLGQCEHEVINEEDSIEDDDIVEAVLNIVEVIEDILKNRGSLIVLCTENPATESMDKDQDAAILLCYDIPSYRVICLERYREIGKRLLALSRKSIFPQFFYRSECMTEEQVYLGGFAAVRAMVLAGIAHRERLDQRAATETQHFSTQQKRRSSSSKRHSRQRSSSKRSSLVKRNQQTIAHRRPSKANEILMAMGKDLEAV